MPPPLHIISYRARHEYLVYSSSTLVTQNRCPIMGGCHCDPSALRESDLSDDLGTSVGRQVGGLSFIESTYLNLQYGVDAFSSTRPRG